MTCVALRRRRRVIAWLDLSVLGQIGPAVASRTLTQHGRRMQHYRRGPTGKTLGMTGVALSADRNMACRLGQSIDRDIATVMASSTLAGQPSMIHLSRLESQLVLVAGVACRAGRDVATWHAQRLGPVVAS